MNSYISKLFKTWRKANPRAKRSEFVSSDLFWDYITELPIADAAFAIDLAK